MPIPIEQFNAALLPTADRIRDFLAKHREEAFTPTEIVAVLENLDEIMAGVLINQSLKEPDGLARRYAEGLDALERAGELRVAQVGGTRYYALK